MVLDKSRELPIQVGIVESGFRSFPNLVFLLGLLLKLKIGVVIEVENWGCC